MDTMLTMESTAVPQKKSNGTVRFTEEVLAHIAEIAAKQDKGVTSIKITSVEEAGKTVRVRAAVTVKYGLSVLDTARRMQDAIRDAIQNMTGLKVLAVDVDVQSLNVRYG